MPVLLPNPFYLKEPSVESVSFDAKYGLATVTWYDQLDDEYRHRAAAGHMTLRYTDGSELRLGAAVMGHPVSEPGQNQVRTFTITYEAQFYTLQPLGG